MMEIPSFDLNWLHMVRAPRLHSEMSIPSEMLSETKKHALTVYVQ